MIRGPGAILLATLLGGLLPSSPALAGPARAVLDAYPYAQTSDLQVLLGPVLEAGAVEMDTLLQAVGDRTADDSAARTAVEAMTHYVNSPGRPDGQREAWASALVRALSRPEPVVRRLALHQLKRAGSGSNVAGIATQLGDPEVAGAAVQSLVSLGRHGAAEAAAKALRVALVRGDIPPGHRAAAVSALGLLRDREALGMLLELATEESEPLREAALWALARIGDPKAEKRLLSAVDTTFYGAGHATERRLVYLQGLIANGHERQARKVLSNLFEEYPAETDPAAHSALLHQAELLIPSKSTDLLLAALAGKDAGLRETATTLLAVRADGGLTGQVVKQLDKSEGPGRRALMEVLARRGGPEAFAALSRHAAEPGPARGRALEAMSRVDFERALPLLVSLLGSEDEALRQRVQAIMTTLGNETVAPFFKQTWQTDLSTPQRLALLEIMAERRERDLVQLALGSALSEDASLRKASFKALEVLAGPEQIPALLELMASPKSPEDRRDLQPAVVEACRAIPGEAERLAPVLQAHAQSRAEVRIALLQVLRALSGPKALAAVRQDAAQDDPAVAEAAQRILAGWPDWDAAELLLENARHTDSMKMNVLFIRGWMRLAQNHWRRPLDDMKPEALREVLAAYTAARSAAERDDERQAIDARIKQIQDHLETEARAPGPTTE